MSDTSNPRKTATVKVRLVETYYRNRLEWEDGPGSLQNVVSHSTDSYFSLDRMTLAEAKQLTKGDLEEYGFYCEDDSYGGFEEYSYKLEYLDPATGKWRYVKNFL